MSQYQGQKIEYAADGSPLPKRQHYFRKSIDSYSHED
jgi:hypothetical protein